MNAKEPEPKHYGNYRTRDAILDVTKENAKQVLSKHFSTKGMSELTVEEFYTFRLARIHQVFYDLPFQMVYQFYVKDILSAVLRMPSLMIQEQIRNKFLLKKFEHLEDLRLKKGG